MALVIPVRAAHIAEAYTEAKGNPDVFRRNEMQWLLDHHPLLRTGIMNAYTSNMQRVGPNLGTPYILGSTLGHRAVRLCTGEAKAYEIARINYKLNMDAANRKPTEGPWNSVEILDRIFGDPELSATMMLIRHDITRASAAAVLGFLCLDEIPEVPTMELELENL